MNKLSTVCVIVNNIESILVIDGSKMSLGNSKAYPVSKALTKRPRGDFNACLGLKLAHWIKLKVTVMFTVCMMRLRMTRGFRIKLAESFQVIHRQLITQKMENDILKRTSRFDAEFLP